MTAADAQHVLDDADEYSDPRGQVLLGIGYALVAIAEALERQETPTRIVTVQGNTRMSPDDLREAIRDAVHSTNPKENRA